jgi:hypothetical protein
VFLDSVYEYCDQEGIEKILESLELKLPYISKVNDPLECKPFIDKRDGITAMEEQCRRSLRRQGKEPTGNWRQIIRNKYETGEDLKLQQKIVGCIDEMKQKSCLLSVSKTEQNTVMWAHYSEKHKGGVIGIDFDNIFPEFRINMDPVDYSKKRPKLNIWNDYLSKEFQKEYFKTLITKSIEWKYEEEFRNIFDDTDLAKLEKDGFACLKDFEDKKTWFLRLNSESIRKVIFGLYTEDSLKLKIKNLIEKTELQHVKLYQAEESETYTLNLVEINK